MKINISIIFFTLALFINLQINAIHINKPTEEKHQSILKEAISKGFIVEKNKKIVIKSIYSIIRLENREEILKCLFDLGLDINSKFFYDDSKWETLLMVASGNGDIKLVSFLLSQSACTEVLTIGKKLL